MACLLAVLLAALTAAAAMASPDPGWPGTMPMNVSDSPTNNVRQPSIAVGASGSIVVAWSDLQAAQPNIYAAQSSDGGQTWSTPQVVSATSYDSRVPDVTIADGRAFVVWRDQDVQGSEVPVSIFEAEIGAGAGRPVPLPVVSNASSRVRLSATAGRLHVVASAGDETDPDIVYSARWLTETSWPTAEVIFAHVGGYGSWHPMLAHAPDGTMHVVWEEHYYTQDKWEILYMTGTAGSGGSPSFGEEIRLATGVKQSVLWPAIAADSLGRVHIAWGEVVTVEVDGDVEYRDYVRYVQYDTVGDTWVVSPAMRIDPDPLLVNNIDPGDTAPGLAVGEVDGEIEVCIAWHGFREGTYPAEEGAEDVLVSCSRDGQNWSAARNMSRSPSDIPSADADVAIRPDLAFAGAVLNGVWEQRVSLNPPGFEVYHTRALDKKVHLPLVMRSY